MSNTFDFNRFKKVLARDFHATYSRFGLAILIIVLLSIAAWLWGWVTMREFSDLEMSEDYYDEYYTLMYNFHRLRYFILGVFVAVAIAPGIIYKSCNLKGRGNYFALLPASITEKYLSMFMYCSIAVPVVVVFGTLLLDTLLTLLPFGPYKVYFWQCYNYWFMGDWLIWTILVPIALLLLTSAVFMFTNTVFKRAKFIKTMLWLMLVGFVLMIVMVLSADWWINWLPKFDEDIFIVIVFIVLPLILAAVFQFLTYRRLKKMQY
ncbi:MAG: hypothetical protein IJQ89_04985 [Bacteroidales bacterium]|nr:hypothetical protein [Bacteroidales bacterium]